MNTDTKKAGKAYRRPCRQCHLSTEAERKWRGQICVYPCPSVVPPVLAGVEANSSSL